MIIDPEAIQAVIVDCLFASHDELLATPEALVVRVEGILRDFVFKRERLESHRGAVESWLRLLPKGFRRDHGGGGSFLNACNQEDGELWTGLHIRMEELLVLGIGLGLANWLMPRQMWSIFPGGLPYVVLNLEPVKVEG